MRHAGGVGHERARVAGVEGRQLDDLRRVGLVDLVAERPQRLGRLADAGDDVGMDAARLVGLDRDGDPQAAGSARRTTSA